MEYRITTLNSTLLSGKRMQMSLADNKTHELWRSFMMARKQITNAIGSDLYSMQVYPTNYFSAFDPQKKFDKWAATAVTDCDNIPEGMECVTLPGGLYAVFTYKGPVSRGAEAFTYIFGTWLPASMYEVDDRPHFELLGEKYKNEAPDSEEEIWIPIKPRL